MKINQGIQNFMKNNVKYSVWAIGEATPTGYFLNGKYYEPNYGNGQPIGEVDSGGTFLYYMKNSDGSAKKLGSGKVVGDKLIRSDNTEFVIKMD